MRAGGGADIGLENAGEDKLHTNTQHLLGELGRLGLKQDSEKQGYAKGSKKESVKLDPYVRNPPLSPMYRFTSVYIRICYNSTILANIYGTTKVRK